MSHVKFLAVVSASVLAFSLVIGCEPAAPPPATKVVVVEKPVEKPVVTEEPIINKQPKKVVEEQPKTEVTPDESTNTEQPEATKPEEPKTEPAVEKPAEGTPKPEEKTAAEAVTTEAPAGDGKPIFKVVDRAGFDEAIKTYRGKIVFVDFWAVWCSTCVEWFPHTVAIQKKYGGKDVVVLGVSLDEGDDPEQLDGVKAFLAKQGAEFDQLVSHSGASTATMEAFELEEGVPHFRVYDRSGVIKLRLSGIPKEGQIEGKIEELLGAKPGEK